MSTSAFQIRAVRESDRAWIAQVAKEHWGSTRIVTRGKVHLADQLPGFIAVRRGEPAGLATYRIDGDACEIVTLNSLVERMGIGSALLDAVKNVAVRAGCRRLWLVTTNDNMAALRFYQMKGFVLVAVHREALRESRRVKAEIPMRGIDGIPLRDEIELEMLLGKGFTPTGT